MTVITSPRRTFVGSADVAPGGGSLELVPQVASDTISHPEPKCNYTDVLHLCGMRKGHKGDVHQCGRCDHAWTSEAVDTFRPATSNLDLCWFKRNGNFIELESAS